MFAAFATSQEAYSSCDGLVAKRSKPSPTTAYKVKGFKLATPGPTERNHSQDGSILNLIRVIKTLFVAKNIALSDVIGRYRNVIHNALSPQFDIVDAKSLGSSWRKIRVTESSRRAAPLALAAPVCETRGMSAASWPPEAQ